MSTPSGAVFSSAYVRGSFTLVSLFQFLTTAADVAVRCYTQSSVDVAYNTRSENDTILYGIFCLFYLR